MSWVAATRLTVALGVALLSQATQTLHVSDNPRDLASLSIHWQFKEPIGNVLLLKDVLYVRGAGRLTALAVADGAVLWRVQLTDAKNPDYGDQGPVAVDDAIAVSFKNHLFIVDAQTGQVRRTVTLGQQIGALLAPPLVVLCARDDDHRVLMRVEPQSGRVIAEREMGPIVYDVRLAGDVVLSLRQPTERSRDAAASFEHVVEAARIADLSEVWSARLRSGVDFEDVGGEICLNVFEGRSKDWKWRPLDPHSGRLGVPLPERRASRVSGGLSWELELIALQTDNTRAVLRRNSLQTGRPVWTATLPGDPNAWRLDGPKLYLHCEHDGGHGYLLVLDWNDGRILQAAYGFRDIRGLLSHGGSLLAWSDNGVTAFSSTVFGASARNRDGLRQKVESILDGVTCDRSGGAGAAAAADLKTLGGAALPMIATEIPRLSEPALAVAAGVLADAGYRPAAAPLAARLQSPNSISDCGMDWGMDTKGATVAILRSLARLGGAAQVDAVASIVEDAARDEETRLQAFATLASIGTPPAIRIIQTLLTRPNVHMSWYDPPSPKDFAALVGRADLDALLRSAHERIDLESMHRARRASESVRVGLAGGGSLLVFRDGYLGGENDLWAAKEDSDGGKIASPAFFLGISVQGAMRASLSGQVLVVECVGRVGRGASPPISIRLSDIERDTDDDGLPDLVEGRLRSDPTRRDTDGDGVSDAEDPTPRGSRPPRNEHDRIVMAILDQFYLFARPIPSPIVIEHEVPLAWDHWRGATLTLTEKQMQQLLASAGGEGILRVRFVPGLREQFADMASFFRPLERDERRYTLEMDSGGSCTVGYEVIVGHMAGTWVIKEWRLIWIS